MPPRTTVANAQEENTRSPAEGSSKLQGDAFVMLTSRQSLLSALPHIFEYVSYQAK